MTCPRAWAPGPGRPHRDRGCARMLFGRRPDNARPRSGKCGSSPRRARVVATVARTPPRPRLSVAGTARRSWAARSLSAACSSRLRPVAGSSGRKAETGRSGRRSSSALGARWEGRCRPNPWGRTPRGRAFAETARPGRCACRRRRCRHEGFRWPSGAECRSSRSARGSSTGRTGRCPGPPIPRSTCPRARPATVSRAPAVVRS